MDPTVVPARCLDLLAFRGYKRVMLDRLISWPDHPDPGVKYFSGAATYRRKIEAPQSTRARNHTLYLDLGRVAVIAELTVNGQDLGIFWRPPFLTDITNVIRAGADSRFGPWPNRAPRGARSIIWRKRASPDKLWQ